MTTNNQPGSEEKAPSSLVFHFIKTPDYRTIHVDGATGGITPHGLIHVAIYSEHAAIPQRTTHKIEGRGLGEELDDERVSRGGIVRDVAASLFMTHSVAKAMGEWLLRRAKEIETARGEGEPGSPTEEPKQS